MSKVLSISSLICRTPKHVGSTLVGASRHASDWVPQEKETHTGQVSICPKYAF